MSANLKLSESAIQDSIRLELGDPRKYPEALLFRNNSGVLTDKDGRFVRYGVGSKGGADLIGMWRHPTGIAQFIALEIKTPIGRQSPEQKRFQQLVESKGGVYALLRSVDDARRWAQEMRGK